MWINLWVNSRVVARTEPFIYKVSSIRFWGDFNSPSLAPSLSKFFVLCHKCTWADHNKPTKRQKSELRLLSMHPGGCKTNSNPSSLEMPSARLCQLSSPLRKVGTCTSTCRWLCIVLNFFILWLLVKMAKITCTFVILIPDTGSENSKLERVHSRWACHWYWVGP